MMRFVPLALAGLLAAAPAFADTEQERAERWNGLRDQLLGARAAQVQQAPDQITIEAPVRAEDAALVPVGVSIGEKLIGKSVAKLYLIIDDNPAPLAGIWTFGPAGDPHHVATRVRVEDYTYVHAIVETADGSLYENAKFVKATGGCSAPAGADQEAAMKRLGKIKLALQPHGDASGSLPAQVMISHPNNNGMQMDQVTRNYTPADFIQSVDVTYNHQSVFKLQSDISLSENPTVEFEFKPGSGPGDLAVSIHDSNKREFEQTLKVDPKAAM
jgi:sulfur-oxidizing protein SoxY